MNEGQYLIVNKNWVAEGRGENHYPTEGAAIETLPADWEQDYKIVKMTPEGDAA